MTTASPAVRRVILGTAGHIDHGKTSLVKRLTGTDCDRLPEEQARGMTLDVGYAAFELPDGTEVGLLDVPGHERLVRTMVAAATSMDLALLIVAADDGPMPQTREHVEILDVLGVRRLVVALTKTDLVDDETCEIAEAEIEDLLEGTGMAGAPIARVSSETGAGFDELRSLLAATLAEDRSRDESVRVFRMPVMRSFLVQGRGAIVTGIPLAGQLEDGASVEVLPHGWKSRVRGIQVHHRDADQAAAHQRVALALSDVRVDKIKRGMVVVAAGTLQPTRRIAARLRVLGHVKKPVAHASGARLHVGSEQIPVRVHVPGAKAVQPGEVTLVELEADRPIATAPGDHLVLRMENAQGTLGGGVVIALLEQRLPRRRPGLIQRLLERAEVLDDPQAHLEDLLLAAGQDGLDVASLARASALHRGPVKAALDTLAQAERIVALGRAERYLHVEPYREARDRVLAAVHKLHTKDAAIESWPLHTVRSAVARTDAIVIDLALDELFQSGELVRTDSGQVRHRDHDVRIPEADRQRCDRVQAALAEGRGQPPDLDTLSAITGEPLHQVKRALRLLEGRGQVFKGGDHFYDGPWLDQAKAALAAFSKEHGGFTPADARTIFDSTRKYVIPLLEALDKSGFSRRAGDRRVLREG